MADAQGPGAGDARRPRAAGGLRGAGRRGRGRRAGPRAGRPLARRPTSARALLAVALVIGSVELLVLRRLRLLNAALRPVAGGDLFPPLPRSRADELGQLTDSISPC